MSDFTTGSMTVLLTPRGDARLVSLAKDLGGAILTDDDGLQQAANGQGVTLLDRNALARAVWPGVLPGKEMEVTLTRPGKEPDQGVGYLEDGTMVVVECAGRHIGQTVTITVSSVLQTVRGTMIFGNL